MITTPYKTLTTALGRDEGWRPTWAQRLEVRRAENTTVYYSHPETLNADELTELEHLRTEGWNVALDSPRLNRLRIQIWQ